jgi:hypothetical protein
MITLKVLGKFPEYTYVIAGTSLAKLREATHTSVRRVFLAMNEIFRRYTPQNNITWEYVMLSEAKHLVFRTEGESPTNLTSPSTCNKVIP